MATYPAHYESDVVLRDGTTVRLRPVRSDDAPGLGELFGRLSDQSLYLRFLGIPAGNTAEIERLVRADHDDEFVIVAEAGGRLRGVASYLRDPRQRERAEVAFTIADALQGRGLGTRMLETLAAIARERGIRTFDAYVSHENDLMMRVFLDSGFQIERQLDSGVVHVSLGLEMTPLYESKAAERSQAAAVASMKSFFDARATVVVGANRERGRIGAEILHNIAAGGYTGRLSAVHPTASSIDGVPAYPRVTAVPDAIDLAVICVPAAAVPAVVDDCIAKGVKALVVISAGFSETGPEGRAAERQILEKVRTAGIRLIGPNCMGIINTDPAVRLNATFSPVTPIAGRVAFSTQSGALGLAILEYVQQLNLGISTFVSVGNKADVSGNDLIQYWADDPRTDVILLYLESFGNPRRFAQIARRVARRKPIVAVKSGRSPAGARAASSHTGALAASDAVVDALFHQAGIIRTVTVEELFDVAALLAHQPLPAGPRMAVLSNAGGPAILAADACEAQGLRLAPLGAGTVAELRLLLPPAASVTNPVDMLASATPEQFGRATRILLGDDQVDSLLVIFIPPLVTKAGEVARAMVAAADGSAKPVLANFLGARGAPPDLAPIPSYAFPEAAVAALARVTAYGAWRRRPTGTVPACAGVEARAARDIITTALARGDGWLPPDEAQALIGAVGIAAVSTRLVSTADQAAAAASRAGYPVVLKAVGPEILHKSDVGGVTLDIGDERALRSAFETMKGRLGDTMTAALVQQMVGGGVELLVGAVLDPTFGPLVACGSGGVLVDLLRDTVFRLHPLTELDAADMVEGLGSVRLLRGYRGRPRADEGAVVDVLLRVSALLEICPEIQELDINPLKVLGRGARAVDVRVRVSRLVVPPSTRQIAY
ncbi:MAG: GNAT family N-acetyltransferase [Acidobacteria bacterium]|nr:GNAT family N-acetyltransferase [Acidobacteriota bacterium]